MPKPPASPPSKQLQGRDSDKPDHSPENNRGAEQEERARKDSKGRPSDTAR